MSHDIINEMMNIISLNVRFCLPFVTAFMQYSLIKQSPKQNHAFKALKNEMRANTQNLRTSVQRNGLYALLQ